MSAISSQHDFNVVGEEPFIVVATLWRGAMVDRYTCIEAFVDRSLAACADGSLILPGKIIEPLPSKRIELLLEALQSERIEKEAVRAIEILTAIKDRWFERNAICHGRMRTNKRAVVIEWNAYSKGSRSAEILRVSDIEMLKKLVDLDDLQRRLGCELGKVDKAAGV